MGRSKDACVNFALSEPVEAEMYRRCVGIVTVHGLSSDDAGEVVAFGCASSNKAAEPQDFSTQAGASRSVSPEMERRERRLREERRRESESW